MSDAANLSDPPSPRAQGRVLKAVAKTWPGFISGAVESRARELIEAEAYGEAADVLDKGIERYGAESVSQLLLAWCLHMAGRQEDALAWALRAIEEEPENADAHWLRANTLFELERPEEAAAALWQAVELTSDNGQYYMQLAWFRYEDQEFVKTRELVEMAVERAPGDPWVHHTAGRIYDHHLRHKLAQAHYERSLELAPDDLAVQCDLAELLQARGRLSSGTRVAQAAAAASLTEDRARNDAVEPADVYEATLRRWSWRWFEWALRAALLLNIVDWIFPTPALLGAVLAGVLAVAYAAAWARSLIVLPARCRRDLVAAGRRGHFAGAAVGTLAVLGGVAAMLIGELNALQHLGVLAALVVAYVGWFWRAARISSATWEGLPSAA
ncbi:tetratricopeptide repeat protein [Glycomyces sp. NRRL B-16210]|uniref:tetratricopeptide repeat protein n=1 Tax=Glycomyces sp. NRRL B-16210 TaxID=1463821 RepID=UPI0004C23C84|nr:tetratricopeptide repeat protein [Glycomyces sp. NRRL B-16210]